MPIKEERKSREEKFKQEMSAYFHQNKEEIQQESKRDMTCCVISRWYRAPEVIITHQGYDQSADIWACGVILAEMMASCSIYYSKDYLSQKRYPFQGKSCYPISPEKHAEDVTDTD